jgi:hypothetical protein
MGQHERDHDAFGGHGQGRPLRSAPRREQPVGARNRWSFTSKASLVKRLLSALAIMAVGTFGSQTAAHGDPLNPWVAAYQQSVYMTGDSLTFGTAPYLTYLFDLAGRELQVKAYPGVTIAMALAWSQAEVEAPPMPPTAVIALGANDTETGLAFMEWIEGMIDVFPPTGRIVWVNFYNTVDTSWQTKNAIVAFVASFHRNVTVLDWASVISQHPEDILPDGIHYTPAGYVLRALTIGAAVSYDCSYRS